MLTPIGMELWQGVTNRKRQWQIPFWIRGVTNYAAEALNFNYSKFYHYSCIFSFLPHRTPKLLSSHCNGSWPFSLHALDGALFQPPDRRHTVKQRGLPLAWSSLKFYPFTPCKTYRLSLLKPLQNARLGLQKISRYPPKGRKKMVELHVYKVKRIFITYFR